MKNVCIIFLLSIIISLTAIGFVGKTQNEGGMSALTYENACAENEFLRIHIRADSNELEAQAVKYYVRDAIVEYLTPIVANCKTKSQALAAAQEHLREMEQVAVSTLQERGYFYGAQVELTKEQFPTRVYEEYVLPAGEYAALIVRLGSGKGDNWWCVVYPPLCFAASANTDVVYKSKIQEIINDWKSRR